jgi:hypothetical protein
MARISSTTSLMLLYLKEIFIIGRRCISTVDGVDAHAASGVARVCATG